MERIASTIAALDLHLLLDNCEHVIGRVAEVVADLLACCPRLRVLATSRERLDVAGETVWVAPPLGLPPPGADTAAAVLAAEAATLFVERVRLVRPGYSVSDGDATAVAGICRDLDGMPLALELAAARMRVLDATEVAAGLGQALALLTGGGRTVAARQRTLRASLDWSYALLTEDERTMLRGLSCFAGGFDLGAAHAVCAP